MPRRRWLGRRVIDRTQLILDIFASRWNSTTPVGLDRAVWLRSIVTVESCSFSAEVDELAIEGEVPITNTQEAGGR